MALEKQRIKRADELAQRSCTRLTERQSKGNEGHLRSDRDYRLRKKRCDGLPSTGHRGCVRRMSVHYGADIFPLRIKPKVESELRWRTDLPLHGLARRVRHREGALASSRFRYRCRSYQKPSFVEADRDIAIMVRNPTALMKRMGYPDDFLSKLGATVRHGCRVYHSESPDDEIGSDWPLVVSPSISFA